MVWAWWFNQPLDWTACSLQGGSATLWTGPPALLPLPKWWSQLPNWFNLHPFPECRRCSPIPIGVHGFPLLFMGVFFQRCCSLILGEPRESWGRPGWCKWTCSSDLLQQKGWHAVCGVAHNEFSRTRHNKHCDLDRTAEVKNTTFSQHQNTIHTLAGWFVGLHAGRAGWSGRLSWGWGRWDLLMSTVTITKTTTTTTTTVDTPRGRGNKNCGTCARGHENRCVSCIVQVCRCSSVHVCTCPRVKTWKWMRSINNTFASRLYFRVTLNLHEISLRLHSTCISRNYALNLQQPFL